MDVKNLKLIARTEDDLRVVSAHLQDSIVNVADIASLKKNNIEIIVDGIHTPKINYPCKAIIKADDKISEVMAASIVAKVFRDNLMIDFGRKFPDFFLEKNKGYPTKEHLNILKSLGPTKYHRKTFKPVLNAR